jgi:glucoamylase
MTEPAAFGLHVLDLPTEKLAPGSTIVFTLKWTERDQWQGEDYTVTVI